jgi:hypothetical protein
VETSERCGVTLTYAVLTPAVRRTAAATLKLTIVTKKIRNRVRKIGEGSQLDDIPIRKNVTLVSFHPEMFAQPTAENVPVRGTDGVYALQQDIFYTIAWVSFYVGGEPWRATRPSPPTSAEVSKVQLCDLFGKPKPPD